MNHFPCDPSALQSFLEGGDELKLSSPQLPNSIEASPIEVDFSVRTNGSHVNNRLPSLLVRQVVQAPSPQVGQPPVSQNALVQPTPSPAPSPFSVPSRSPLQQLSPSPSQSNLPLRSPLPCASPSTTHSYLSSPSPGQSLHQNQTKSPTPTASPLPYTLPQSKSPAAVATLASSPAPPLQAVPVAAPMAATLNLTSSAVGSPMVQFLPAPAPQTAAATATRPHVSSVKPIQPKQPQILPKPASGSPHPQFGAGIAKPVTVNHQRNTVSVAPAQPNQIVIGTPQNQPAMTTMLPNTVGTQGTLLLNHITLSQNPMLFQGGAGGLQNLQLVMRPQQTSLATGPNGQPHGQAGNGTMNPAAFLTALQVQNHAAHQALLGSAKGQAVVIPGTTNLLATQQTIQGRQNVLLNTRVVNTNQGPLQLQQLQTPNGPITVAIAPQHIRGLSNLGVPMTSVLQGMAVSQAAPTQITGTGLPAGVVLNSQTVNVSQDMISTLTTEQPSVQPKVPSVNLEELLKQTGIVPADPTPPPLSSTNVAVTVAQASATVTTQAPSTVSTSLAQMVFNPSQQQLKLSIAQDGSFYLQRPIVQTVQALQQGVQPSTIPLCLSSESGSTIPSVLLQRLNAAPQTAVSSTDASLIPLTVQSINLTQTPQNILAAPCTVSTATMVHSCVTTSSTTSGLIQTHPTLVQSLAQTSPVPSLIQKQPQQQQQPQEQKVTTTMVTHQNLTQQLPSSSNVTLGNQTMTIGTTAPTTVTTAPTNIIMSGPSITSMPLGHKLHTIQLSCQNQENLQKISSQLRQLSSIKAPTAQHKQLIQQLQASQNKILAQGKVISIQPAPGGTTFQLVQSQPQANATIVQTASASLATAQPTVAAPNKTVDQPGKPVQLSNLLKQVPNCVTSRVVTSAGQSNTTTVATATTITVPTQIKVNNQMVTLTPQQRQTFHQLQQQLKTLSTDQQQVFLSQNKQAVILKLQQPQPASTTTTPAVVSSSSCTPATITVATSTGITGGLLVIQPNRGIKRPAPTPLSHAALIQQQLTKDQSEGLKPDFKMPFRSVKDACRRLLKYHVFNSKTPTQKDLEKADDLFETVSEQLLEKAHQVLSKYRCLILQESMKEHPTSELVMLNKMMIEDEKRELEEDRKTVKEGKDLNLPPLPDHWLSKMDSLADLCTTITKTTVHLVTTLASTPGAMATTTTVHTAPLSVGDVKPSTTTLIKEEDSEKGHGVLGNEIERGTGGIVNQIKREKGEDVMDSEPAADKNYDEWAEIQKELEMYPLDGDAATDALGFSSPQVDFDPAEDGSSLADFEPPVVKVERMDTSADWDPYPSASKCSSNESETAVEGILASESSGHFQHNFRLHKEGCGADVAAGSTRDTLALFADPLALKSQDDDLNAQVQSAINSILNLQRTDEILHYDVIEEDENGDEYVLEPMDVKEEQMTIDYEAAIEAHDTCEVDDALEEAVKSILM